ncbi:putative addiction module component [Terrimicrobium sacchariphilum]|uniref:Putative addiction module component n=1 Tax=Terrimicrobium sacchariphilum TaxID=690879 RepID=A0A146G505_TERSA|nr:addiction module protein [Terrimicrobium sacchariphilum]GAT32492.1 putative addiction module component [Terrimicrobium sacchariphilum]
MSATVDLQQMTVAEKLRLMEALWRDLSREDLASPAWHGEILAERDRLIAAGKEQFIDWETAKKQLRQELP